MKKLVITFALLVSCTSLIAEDLYWFADVNDSWTEAGNWANNFDTIPDYYSNVYILDGQEPVGDTPACHFGEPTIADVAAVVVQGMGYTGIADFNMTGGDLTAVEFFVGSGAPGKGVMTMHSGKVTSLTYFVVGQAGGNGELIMNDGELYALNFWVANLANSTGKVTLNGGTIYISGTISIEGTNGGIGAEPTANGVIDLCGGKVVITKDEDLRAYINAWAGAGFITAYGGAGTVIAERDAVTGYTSFSAAPYTAQTRYWYNNGGDDLWTTAGNWGDAFNSAPQEGDSVVILDGAEPIGDTNSCLFTAGMTANVATVSVQGLGYTGDANMTITGGDFAANELFVGAGGAGTGTVTITDGNVGCSTYLVVGHGAGSNGTLKMSGGNVTALNFWVANGDGSKGRVSVDGGTINITGTIAVAQGESRDGVIDITGGKIVFQKNEDLVWIGPWLAKNEHLTAYAGSGHIISWRDAVTGWTTIAATPVAGDFTGEGEVDMQDFTMFCENWLDGGTYGTSENDLGYGYTPFDLNYDGKVNFQDFAMMTANW